MKFQNKLKGDTGEKIAIEYLKSEGHIIIETNYRCTYGEVDIISLHDGYLIFTEVKSRGSDVYGRGVEAVNKDKQRHIISSAYNYICEKNLCDSQVRFDVIEVLANDEPVHYTNAFYED